MTRLAPRQLEALLYAIAGICALTAAVAGVTTLTNRPHWQAPQPVVTTATTEPIRSAPPTETDLAIIWKRDLRQRLIELPPAPVKPAPAPSALAIRLVGTAVDNQERFGLFDRAGEGTVLRQVGEDLDGYQIVEIGPRRVLLRRGSQDLELQLPVEPDELRP